MTDREQAAHSVMPCIHSTPKGVRGAGRFLALCIVALVFGGVSIATAAAALPTGYGLVGSFGSHEAGPGGFTQCAAIQKSRPFTDLIASAFGSTPSTQRRLIATIFCPLFSPSEKGEIPHWVQK